MSGSRRHLWSAPRTSGAAVAAVLAVAVLALATPQAAAGADTMVVPERSGVVLFVLILLLVGSVTAGILFAVPFRSRQARMSNGTKKPDPPGHAPGPPAPPPTPWSTSAPEPGGKWFCGHRRHSGR